MRIYIKKVRDQAPAAPNTKAKKDSLDRLLKPQNPDLYNGHLYMECYYFCQQYEDHFEVARSLGHKHVPFTAEFLKNHILNWWQQYKTYI